MFAVEGWKLGQIATQTLPTKKRKRDKKEDITLLKTPKLKTGVRKNPFSMIKSNNSTGNPKSSKKSTSDLAKDEGKESKQVNSSNETQSLDLEKASRKAEKRRRHNLKTNAQDRIVNKSVSPQTSTCPPENGQSVLTPLQQKMRAKLAGSQFRHINEKLYTTDSSQALTLFTEQPSLFHDVRPFTLMLIAVSSRIQTPNAIMAHQSNRYIHQPLIQN
jgi:ribosomal RNA-processing protein 8